MKKSLLVLASCLTLSTAFADGEKTVNVKKDKPIISNGFLLNLGLGFPSSKTEGGPSQSLGIQGSLELGNQWYFVKNETIGVGLKVSWLQAGYSKKTESIFGFDFGIRTIDLRFLKIAPMFSYAITESLALDAYVDIAPTVMLTAVTSPAMGTTSSDTDGSLGIGVLFAPGVKLRYHKLAFGFDYSLGSLATASSSDDANTIDDGNYKVSYAIPRVYIGFKF